MKSHQKCVFLQASGLPYPEGIVETNTTHQESQGRFLQYLDSFTMISPLSDSSKHNIIPFPQQKYWEFPVYSDLFWSLMVDF